MDLEIILTAFHLISFKKKVMAKGCEVKNEFVYAKTVFLTTDDAIFGKGGTMIRSLRSFIVNFNLLQLSFFLISHRLS